MALIGKICNADCNMGLGTQRDLTGRLHRLLRRRNTMVLMCEILVLIGKTATQAAAWDWGLSRIWRGCSGKRRGGEGAAKWRGRGSVVEWRGRGSAVKTCQPKAEVAQLQPDQSILEL